MTDAPPLPSFTRLTSDYCYAALHELLWPKEPTSSQPGDSAEPSALRKCIQARAADMSLWVDDQGDVNAMDLDEDESQLPLSPLEIRYIDLSKHEALCVHRLHNAWDSHTFIIRQEYVEFMTYAMNCGIHERRFFLTGQPGIGKGFGACYFLFFLLASGQSVFFIPNPGWVYYFSPAGVDTVAAGQSDMGDPETRAAIERSWVLIDVVGGLSETWLPERWVGAAAGLIWTSSPKARRMYKFTTQLHATVWYMKPWSSQEIAALTKLDGMDPDLVRERLSITGPVAWSLAMDDPISVDSIICRSLAAKLFDLATSDASDRDRVFLLMPQEVLDESGRPSLERQKPSFTFLSNDVADRTLELMKLHDVEIRRQLAQAFAYPYTRPAAGKLVESILNRALIHRKIDLPDAFGGGPVKGHLELIGNAEDFVLEPHTPPPRECRPLYLRPQSPAFASQAVDAVLVTVAQLCLVQTSLAPLHSHGVKTLLQILARLETNKIEVDALDLVYWLVGTDENRVEELVREASEKLEALQAGPQARELGDLSQFARNRLGKLRVVGFTIDMETDRLVRVS
ncbi:hypothetical protein FB451DRAFT_1225285 [Mycena latifolia]|nr:hypothetical protein FB451DRAFT_1225285 [Mycena latifolia]